MPPGVVYRRARRLRQLSIQKKNQFRVRFMGRWLSALTLTEMINGQREALSGNYLPVKLAPEVPGNRLVKGRVAKLEKDYLVLANEGLEIVQ